MGENIFLSFFIIVLFCFCAFVFLIVREGLLKKALVKLGLKNEMPKTNWTAISWTSCLQKLNYTVDIAFFGDSITRGGDFQAAFKNKKIINLGCSGDTITGLIQRIPMVNAVSPKKVFILCGINSITNFNTKNCINKYEELVMTLNKLLPKTQFYIQSVLPISASREKKYSNNKTIRLFNKKLELLAKKHGLVYIDLHKLYVLNDCLNPAFTTDGIHLNSNAYDPWINAIKDFIE